MDLSIAGEQTDGCLPTHRTLGGRALWWVSAVLLAGMIAIVLPIGQIRMLGAQLGGVIGSYDYVTPGHYEVAYSGGHFTLSPSSMKTPGDDALVSPDPTSGDPRYGCEFSVYGANATAHCYDKITATFTWIAGPGNEPPLASVIVQEDCTAGLEGTSPTTTFTVNDGLGDISSTSQSVSGQRYSVVSTPGTSFTVNATPDIQGYDNGGPTPAAAQMTPSTVGLGSFGCRLYYCAKTVVPRINLSGTTTINGKQSILIGQEVSVSLSFSPPLDILTKVSNWTWMIDGDPFKGFDPTNPVMGGPANGQPMTGKAMELANPLNESSPSYFYRSIFTKGASPGFIELSMAQKVTCTATVTFPDKLTAQVKAENTVNVYQPAHTMVATAGMVGSFSNHTQYLASTRAGDPANLADKGSVTGSNWAGTVSTPVGFRILSDRGTWGYAQIISSSRFFLKDALQNGAQNMVGNDRVDIWDPNIHQITLIEKDDPGTNSFGLDVSFPFGGVSFFSADGNWGDAPKTIAGTGIGDSPGFGIVNATFYESINFGATNYMLYKPPSASGRVTFVPLHFVKWSASGFNDFANNLHGPNAVTIEGDNSTSILPEWDRVDSPLAMVNQ